MHPVWQADWSVQVWAGLSFVGTHTGAGDHTAETAAAVPSGNPAEKHESNAPAIDVLFDGQEVVVLESKRVHTNNTHGTGKIGLLCCVDCPRAPSKV